MEVIESLGMHFHSNLNPFPDRKDYQTVDYDPTPMPIENGPFNYH